MTPWFLFDRDGTIIVDKHYLADPEGVEFLPGAVEGLRQLASYPLVVVTNQSGIGRGYLTEKTLHQIHQRMEALLAAHQLVLSGVYFCPHHPDRGCSCRKPSPGLGLQAAADLGLDPAWAVVVGDKESDIEFGRQLGAWKTFRVAPQELETKADHLISSLAEIPALL